MKIASFIATALLAVSASATTAVYHDYEGALRGISLNNACVTASDVKTISATRNCVKLTPIVVQEPENGSHTEWVCEQWETSQVSHPRAFNRSVCAEYVSGRGEQDSYCARYEQRADFLPATIKVSVVTTDGEYSDFPGVSQSFTFPTCK